MFHILLILLISSSEHYSAEVDAGVTESSVGDHSEALIAQTEGSATEAAPLLEVDPATGEITINTATLDANLPAFLAQRPEVSLGVVDGTPTGVQISGVRDSFLTLGFRDGDIVTLVNGVSAISIDSPLAALQFYSSVRSSPELEVQLLRDGQPMTLRFHLR